MSGLFGGSRKPRETNQQNVLAQSRFIQAAQSGFNQNMTGYQQLPRLDGRRKQETGGGGGGSAQGGAFGTGGRSYNFGSSILGATGKRNTFLGS